jgi:hypothetical protein
MREPRLSRPLKMLKARSIRALRPEKIEGIAAERLCFKLRDDAEFLG